MKKKVRIVDSIAGLADPKSPAELQQKYDKLIRDRNAARVKNGGQEMSKAAIEAFIGPMKERDRYGEKPLGFPRDWSFRPNQEVMIDAKLAEKWEAAGICVILEDDRPVQKAA